MIDDDDDDDDDGADFVEIGITDYLPSERSFIHTAWLVVWDGLD